jgi:hypothetical protein
VDQQNELKAKDMSPEQRAKIEQAIETLLVVDGAPSDAVTKSHIQAVANVCVSERTARLLRTRVRQRLADVTKTQGEKASNRAKTEAAMSRQPAIDSVSVVLLREMKAMGDTHGWEAVRVAIDLLG